ALKILETLQLHLVLVFEDISIDKLRYDVRKKHDTSNQSQVSPVVLGLVLSSGQVSGVPRFQMILSNTADEIKAITFISSPLSTLSCCQQTS
ncbi:hypothetical protein Bpfe_019219, partial [Biomphalaria pfeifferi]